MQLEEAGHSQKASSETWNIVPVASLVAYISFLVSVQRTKVASIPLRGYIRASSQD